MSGFARDHFLVATYEHMSLNATPALTIYKADTSLRARTHWTDKICLALPKVSTKFVSAKFSICQSWALALKNSKIFVNHKVSITWKLFIKYLSSSGSKESYFAACFLVPFPLFPLASALESSSWLLSI